MHTKFKDKTVGTPRVRTYICMYINTCLEFAKLEYMYFNSIYVCKTRTYVFLMEIGRAHV